MTTDQQQQLSLWPRGDTHHHAVGHISHEQAEDILGRYHYLGDKGFKSEVAYGLACHFDIVGAAIFHGPSAPETSISAFGVTEQEGIWELGRFVLSRDHNGGNAGTWFLARAIKALRTERDVRALISYADSTFHRGALYQAASFKYCGTTQTQRDFQAPDGSIVQRGYHAGMEGKWVARSLKHRYVRVYDKTLTLKWPITPYPKDEEKQDAAL